MSRTSSIRPEQYLDFVVQLYFGPMDNILQNCIERGYFDLQRTLHNIAEVDSESKLKQEAIETLYKAINTVTHLLLPESLTQAGFDNWHEQMCEKLETVYKGVKTKKGAKMFYI